MFSTPRTNGYGRSVRFMDTPRQHAAPAEMRPNVRFDEHVREHDIYTQDPPTRATYAEEPPSPRLRTRPLPPSPDVGTGELRSMEQSVPAHTPTPSNSPSNYLRSSPLPMQSSPSPTPSPEPQELSAYLADPDFDWDLRRLPLDQSLRAKNPGLNLPGFTSERKSCVLHFVVDEKNDWTVNVPPRPDALPLSVWDVLVAITRSLYSRIEESALLPWDARYEAAIAERPRRLLGKEDGQANVLRNIDFYAEGEAYFHGLVEETVGKEDAQFLVRLGRRP